MADQFLFNKFYTLINGFASEVATTYVKNQGYALGDRIMSGGVLVDGECLNNIGKKSAFISAGACDKCSTYHNERVLLITKLKNNRYHANRYCRTCIECELGKKVAAG